MTSSVSRFRFSLQSLLFLVALVGFCYGLWVNWGPWRLDVSQNRETVDDTIFPPASRDLQFYLLKKKDDEEYLTVRRVHDDTQMGEFLLYFPSIVFSAMSLDGNLLAIARIPREDPIVFSAFDVEVWNVRTKRRIAILRRKGPGGTVPLAFSPSGKELLTWHTVTNDCDLWDVSGSQKDNIPGTEPFKRAKSLQQRGVIRLSLRGHKDQVQCAEFSANGELIVTGCDDGSVRIWGASDGRLISRLPSHGTGIVSLSFSADGSLCMTGDLHAAKVWDTESGKCITTWEPRAKFITAVCLSDDGMRAAAAADQGEVWAWRAGSSTWYQILKSQSNDDTSYEPYAIAFQQGNHEVRVGDYSRGIQVLARTRPESWHGIFWLKECWAAIVFGLALLWSILRDWRALSTGQSGDVRNG